MTSTSHNSRNDASGNFLHKLKNHLNWGKGRLRQDLRELFGRSTFDEAVRENLEARLLQADVGVDATAWLLYRLETSRASTDDGVKIVEQCVRELLGEVEQSLSTDETTKPFVILGGGVNGTGKTTTIGKLARHLIDKDYSVMFAAGDTFRAAAVEQLS